MSNYSIGIVVSGKDNASGVFGHVASSLRSLGSAALTVAGGALAGAGAALAGAAFSGLKFNNSMEIVTAQLNAFTKDGAKSAEILEMIKDRASKTPFAFEEMAAAAASLLPASKTSGEGLEKLIGLAEILGASNPAEGLEGAAFALKEALGGDFVSIVERFNLPRQRLNQLKEEGVPALEAVQIAMREMGLDADLVSNLANTASGRWSTFKDTLQGLAATVTAPLFDALSGGLATVNDALTANGPLIQALAEQLAGQVKAGIEWLGAVGLPALTGAWQALSPVVQTVFGVLSEGVAIVAPILASFFQQGRDGAFGFGETIRLMGERVQIVLGGLQAVTQIIFATISAVIAEHGATISANLSAAWSTIQTTIATVTGIINQIIDQAFGIVLRFLAENQSSIQAFIGETWTAISEIIRVASELISGIVTAVFLVIRDFLAAHGDDIQRILTTAWTIIRQTIGGALDIIKGLLQAALAVFKGDWQGAWDAIRSMSESVVMRLGDIIKAGLDLIASFFGTSLQGLIDLWSSNFQSMLSIVSNIDWAGVGRSIIEGIVGGVLGAAGSLADAAADAALSALDAAKSALGINSPSKVFETQVGANIALGMARGISGGAGQVQGAASGLAGAAVQGAQTSITQNLYYTGIHQEEGDVRQALRMQSLAMGLS